MVSNALFIAFIPLLAVPLGVHPLWPIPRTLSTGSEGLKLAHGFAIQFQGSLSHHAPSDLKAAVSRTLYQLEHDGLERLVIGRARADTEKIAKAKQLNVLNVELAASASNNLLGIAQNTNLPLGMRDEAYTLHVPANGSPSVLSANSTLGLLRGLTTFSQLWYTSGSTIYTVAAPIAIWDKPAYPYRGLMLDTARNFFPKVDILRTLDAMSYVKASTFHWHIVDSQSFPLVIPEFPELSAKGAYAPDQVYTPADVQEIVAYAGARGIDVMMEIDTPGHTSAISASHPEYVACPDARPWASFANEPPAGQLRLASPSVLTFVQQLITSALKELPGPYFSTGGDEINLNCYKMDDITQTQLVRQNQTFEQALDTFVQATHKPILSARKVPVVWEEMALNNNVTLSSNTIVMVWISSANAKAVVDQGFQIVHAPSDYFYLDCGAGNWLGDSVAGNSWCDPFKTWQKAYSFDPLANITSDQAHLVLGGEQLLWTEQSSPSNMDSIIWPRAAASAEVFWTGNMLPSGNATSTSEALSRLHDLRYRLVQRGIRAIPLQPHWCALRPHACDLTT